MSDTISRSDAIEQMQTWAVNLINPKMLSREDAIYILESMPSAQPEQDREFIKLTVRNSNGRPYYSIIYLEFDDNGVGHDFEGYSSYSLDVISDYLKKYFMPSAQPNLQQSCNQLATDVISRQEAIDALKEHRALYCDNTPVSFSKLSYAEKSRVDELDTAIATLVNLPSAQPERKKGKWILECDAEGEGDNLYRCPECGCNYSCQEYDIPNFCPNCGSYNGGENDDKG